MKAPMHLAPAEKKMWLDIASTYGIDDAAGVALLSSAMDAHQRARECREAVERDGMMLGTKAHPLLGHERDSRKAFVMAIDKLGLDIVAPQAPGRPSDQVAVRRVK